MNLDFIFRLKRFFRRALIFSFCWKNICVWNVLLGSVSMVYFCSCIWRGEMTNIAFSQCLHFCFIRCWFKWLFCNPQIMLLSWEHKKKVWNCVAGKEVKGYALLNTHEYSNKVKGALSLCLAGCSQCQIPFFNTC